MSDTELNTQADQFAKYLIGDTIVDHKIRERYRLIVRNGDTIDAEPKLIRFAFLHPGYLPFLDAALVFVRPESELRRRLYIMFAILESTPEYADYFLSHQVGFAGFLRAFWAGVRAAFRLLVGLIILKIGRL